MGTDRGIEREKLSERGIKNNRSGERKSEKRERLGENGPQSRS